MVGVQDLEECPQCKYNEAKYELQTRNGSEWLFCDRCGYHLRIFPLVDRIKSRQIEIKMRAFAKKGKFRKALNLLGYGHDLPDKRVKEEVERRLKNGIYLLKRTKAGKFIYRRWEQRGYGAYSCRDNEKGFGSVGRLPSDPKKRRTSIKSLISARNDKVSIKITEVLCNGKIINH